VTENAAAEKPESQTESAYGESGLIKRLVISLLSLSLFMYPLLAGFVGSPPALVFRPTYLMILLMLCALVLPSGIFRRASFGELALNLVLIAGALVSVWVAYSWMEFVLKFTLTFPQKVGCVLLILAALEMTRRTSVRPLNYVALAAIAYALFGNVLPGLFGHAGMDIDRLLWSQIFTTDGLFGTPLAIGATYIGLFVFFAAFLEASGGSQKFMNLTMALAGRFRGGPAKVAVVASALMGMISGSAVTNVVTTGVITIPMMKRVGYRPQVAAGIEATASLGSQITPPILGATAFLMSEITGVPLITIMALTLVPCILFFTAIFLQVHLAALKHNIKGIPVDRIPKLWTAVVEVIPFVLPIAVLVYFLWYRYSPDYAISVAIMSFFATCLLTKESREGLARNFMKGIRQGAAACIPLVGSLAMAGVIIGVLTMTGLGDRLSYLIEMVSGGNIHLIIITTALACMLLGMGLVTIGAYILVAVTIAPVMVDLGVPLIVAHLFVFYFAVMSAISPPVMVGVFAASSIADADPMKTAYHALRFSVVGFIVPFIFIYEPRILMVDGVTWVGVYLLLTVFVGIAALAMSFERYSFFNALGYWRSALLFVVGLMIILPSVTLSTVGLVCFTVIMMNEYMRRNRSETAEAAAE
jgi:TRAP transporter 4TM/12TM fusion protein